MDVDYATIFVGHLNRSSAADSLYTADYLYSTGAISVKKEQTSFHKYTERRLSLKPARPYRSGDTNR
jgi:hypothetical protein